MRKRSRYSIKTKIIAITISLTLATVVVTVSVCFMLFQNLLKKNLIQSTEFGLQVAVGSVAEQVNNITMLPAWANSNSNITSLLSKGDSYSSTLKLEAYDRFNEEYMNNKSSEYINRIMIANFDGLYLQNVKPVSDGSSKDFTAVMQLDYFDELLYSDNYAWIGIVEDSMSAAKKQIIPILRPIHSAYNIDIIGWMYIAVSADIVSDAIKNYTIPSDSDLFFTINNSTYRLYNNELIPYDSDYTLVREISGDNMYSDTYTCEIKDSNGRHCTVISCPSSIDGWYISQIMSDEQLSEQRYTYFIILFIIGLVILTFGFIIALFLNRVINKPVRTILTKVKAISGGDFSPAPEIESEDEFGEIGCGINELSKNVLILMDNRVAAEKQQRELEYQILQSQINPHFLYNTLNSIKWMATIQNAAGIAEMTTALSHLLKNISKGTKQMIPLSEELELLKDYTLIQEYRYGGVITINYDIANDLYDCIVPKLSLQPLVENAIFHGIEAKGSDGIISISGKQIGDDLLLVVEDNGIGIAPEMIDKIMNGEDDNVKDSFRKVGIANVHKRIQYAYSETSKSNAAPVPNTHYGIKIESKIGEYTRMSILVPIVRSTESF